MMRTIAALLALTSMSVLVLPASAGDDVAFEVSPSVIEVAVRAARPEVRAVVVSNVGSRRLVVTPSIGDLALTSDGDPHPLPRGSTLWSASQWCSIDPNPLTIAPGSRAALSLRIRRRAGDTGGRYGVLILAAEPDGSPATEFGVSIRSSVCILLTPAPPEAARCRVASIQASDAGAGGLRFEAVLVNTGRVHCRASASAHVVDGSGHPVATIGMKGGSGTVLPGGSRRYAGGWPGRHSDTSDWRVEIRFAGPGVDLRRTVAITNRQDSKGG